MGSTIIGGTTGYASYGTAMPTYGAASYGTAMPAYGASYGATPMYGGYGSYGEDPARNGHPAAGRADDGPGQAVRDAGGDAEADGERVRQRVRGRGRWQAEGRRGQGGCRRQGQEPGRQAEGQEVDTLLRG